MWRVVGDRRKRRREQEKAVHVVARTKTRELGEKMKEGKKGGGAPAHTR